MQVNELKNNENENNITSPSTQIVQIANVASDQNDKILENVDNVENEEMSAMKESEDGEDISFTIDPAKENEIQVFNNRKIVFAKNQKNVLAPVEIISTDDGKEKRFFFSKKYINSGRTTTTWVCNFTKSKVRLCKSKLVLNRKLIIQSLSEHNH